MMVTGNVADRRERRDRPFQTTGPVLSGDQPLGAHGRYDDALKWSAIVLGGIWKAAGERGPAGVGNLDASLGQVHTRTGKPSSRGR
jgi:hypothetical protein